MRAGDVLDLSPIGARFTVTRTAEDTGGESFEMEWELDPETGGTPVHLHPAATETTRPDEIRSVRPPYPVMVALGSVGRLLGRKV